MTTLPRRLPGERVEPAQGKRPGAHRDGRVGLRRREFVCPLVEETRRPERNIPRLDDPRLSIIFLTIALLLRCAAVHPAGGTGRRPAAALLFANRVFGEYGQLFLVTPRSPPPAAPTQLVAGGDPADALRDGAERSGLPAIKQLSWRARTPWVAVLFVAAITGLPILILGQDPDSDQPAAARRPRWSGCWPTSSPTSTCWPCAVAIRTSPVRSARRSTRCRNCSASPG